MSDWNLRYFRNIVANMHKEDPEKKEKKGSIKRIGT